MGKRSECINKMRIAWFTPFGADHPVGEYSKYAVEALKNGTDADFDVFVIPQEHMQTANFRLVFYADGQDISDVLPSYDIIIYNMGDSYDHYKGIFRIMRQFPGIVLLHDACMLNFFRRWYEEEEDIPYERLLAQTYGEGKALKIMEAHRDPVMWSMLDKSRYHLLNLLGKYSLSIGVHSQWHKKLIKAADEDIVEVLPLVGKQLADTEPKKNDNGNDRICLLTTGTINAEKAVTVVMDAIADSKLLRDRIHYVVAGTVPEGYYLKQILEKYQEKRMEHFFNIIGCVDENEIETYYASADILCHIDCSRDGVSPRALRNELLDGKTIVVADMGMYHEIPDDCAAKVDTANMKASVTQALCKLVMDRDYCIGLGKNAQAYAKGFYSEHNYVAALMELIKKTIFLRPLYKVMDKVKTELKFMDMETKDQAPNLDMMENVSSEMSILFSNSESEEKECGI